MTTLTDQITQGMTDAVRRDLAELDQRIIATEAMLSGLRRARHLLFEQASAQRTTARHAEHQMAEGGYPELHGCEDGPDVPTAGEVPTAGDFDADFGMGKF